MDPSGFSGMTQYQPVPGLIDLAWGPQPATAAPSPAPRSVRACAEEVQAAAAVCRFCGHEFEMRSVPTELPAGDYGEWKVTVSLQPEIRKGRLVQIAIDKRQLILADSGTSAAVRIPVETVRLRADGDDCWLYIGRQCRLLLDRQPSGETSKLQADLHILSAALDPLGNHDLD